MSKLTSICIAVGTLALGACAHSVPKAEYDAAISRAERDYKEAKAKCEGYSGNARDICEAEAKAQRAKSEADAKAAYSDTSKARYDQRVAAAEADYKVARQRCDDLAGDNKDVCIKDAEAALARAKADAKTAYRTY